MTFMCRIKLTRIFHWYKRFCDKAKLMRAGFIFLSVGVSISGCDLISDKFTQAMYRGTLRGLEACVAENKSSLVPEANVRDRCVELHKQPLNSINTSGWRAEVFPLDGRRVRVRSEKKGWKNSTVDQIITHIEISVSLYDETGKEQRGTVIEKGLWVMPGEYVDVSTSIDMVSTMDVPYCENEPYRNCRTWTAGNFWGLKFIVN